MLLDSADDIYAVLDRSFQEHGAVLVESELGPAFFDLRTHLTGELFQKIMNYQLKLAIVVSIPREYGEHFNALVNEQTNHEYIRFFKTMAVAADWLLTKNEQ